MEKEAGDGSQWENMAAVQGALRFRSQEAFIEKINIYLKGAGKGQCPFNWKYFKNASLFEKKGKRQFYSI